MDHKNLNRGLRPTGRVMMLIMLTLFLILFAITGVSFAMIAHTGSVRDQDLFDIALYYQLGERTVQSRRGTITDRNGVVIATQHPSYTLFANMHPEWGRVGVVEDIEYTANRLSEVIDLTPGQIVDLLSRPYWNIEFGFAGRHLSFTEYNQIREMALPGIDFIEELTRFNPPGEFAAHTIGYTMFGETDEIIGAMGLERYFDNELTGTDGRFQFQRDRFGFRQPGQEPIYIEELSDGYDIRLTIDSTIQVFLETAMNEVVEQVEPDGIVAIVMNASTGEILAAGSRPTFNPNDRNPESYANPIIYPFEPGSTLKIFTYAAAINEGTYQGDQTFRSGLRELPGNTLVHDHPLIYRGEMTFDNGFFVSANTATIDLLRHSVTPPQFLDYLRLFGFGEITGLPLHGEHAGSVPNFNYSVVDAFMSGFGQAVEVTPIQQIQAMTAFINDGEVIRPQLVAEIYDPNTGTIVHQFEREVIGDPITAETAEQMRELMVGVVESDIGTGREHYVLDVSSGGKTGTAEIPDPEGSGYLDDIHIYSYIGFAPAEDPEIIMFVAIENPTTDFRNGHPYAGQIYCFVMNHTLNYLGLTQGQASTEEVIHPQFESERTQTTPSVVNLSTDEAVAMVEELGLTPVVIGDNANVFRQEPMPGVLIAVGDKVFIQTDMEDHIPDFTGWTRMQITQYAILLELDWEINGHGLGVSQTIRAGRVVKQGDSLIVTLE